MGLKTRIWASRLGLGPQGQDMSFEGGGWTEKEKKKKKKEKEKEKEKFAL